MEIALRLFVTISLLASVVEATPEGAPGTACVHMTPDHNTSIAQNDVSHFTTKPNKVSNLLLHFLRLKLM